MAFGPCQTLFLSADSGEIVGADEKTRYLCLNMQATEMAKLLSVGDLRTIGKNKEVIAAVQDKAGFNLLFQFLYHTDNRIVLRAADAIEKISAFHPHYLNNRKKDILGLCQEVKEKGLQWHLALLLPRLKLTDKEFEYAWTMLTRWVMDKSNSRIVRVNSIQGLFEMIKLKNERAEDFNRIVSILETENIPSLQARIRLLKQGAI